MEEELRQLLLGSELEEDAVSELTRLGITSMQLLAAVHSEEKLETSITSRIQWQGPQEKHIAKGLGLTLAWKKARGRVLTQEEVHRIEVDLV